MSYVESIQPTIETQDAQSTHIGDVLDQMWSEIFDETDKKIKNDIEQIVQKHSHELEELVGTHFLVQADDIVFASPQTQTHISAEPTIFSSRPAEVSGSFQGLTSIDAESLPNWASVYGRPMGSIPGVRILNTPKSQDAMEYDYFIPIFSIKSITDI